MAGRPDSFGEAIFEIRAVDEQLTRTLRKDEAQIKQSVGRMGAEFNSLEGSTIGVQQGMSALGPAMSAVGGNAANMIGPLASASATMAGLGAALLSVGGVLLIAGIALAAIITRLVSLKKASEEAAEAQRQLHRELEKFATEEYVRLIKLTDENQLKSLATIEKAEAAMAALNAETEEQKLQLAGDTVIVQIGKDAEVATEQLRVAEGTLAALLRARASGYGVVQRPGTVAQANEIIARLEQDVEEGREALETLAAHRLEVERDTAQKIGDLHASQRQTEFQARRASEETFQNWRVQMDAQFMGRIMAGRIKDETEAMIFIRQQFEQMQERTVGQRLIEKMLPFFQLVEGITDKQRQMIAAAAGIPSGETAAGGMAAVTPDVAGLAGLSAAAFKVPSLPAGGRTGGADAPTGSVQQQALAEQKRATMHLANIDAKTSRGGMGR